MNNAVFRSNGITDAERYLQALCERSFLRFWSYPGVYRDQSSGGNAQDGKEVCDLLVVFENHVLIFSDKNVIFPDTGNLDLDWSRWVRKAVLKSGEQLYGAERWIKDHPDRLFIDRNCKQPFPIDLPEMSMARFHRIIVAHGASERCQRELGGSGSLMLFSSIIGSDHLLKISEGGMPFAVGQLDPTRGFVHIYDDTTLQILLTTLDTIHDFASYLDKKERLFERMLSVGAAGEEELLAFYLGKLNDEGEHDFILDDDINGRCSTDEINGLVLEEGFWEEFSQSSERKSQLAANRISYAWDALIEHFSTHILNDTQYIKDPLGARNQEKTVRFLARESRTRRRLLAKALLDLMENSPTSYNAVRVMMPSKVGDPYFVFLLVPHLQGKPETEYREVRRNLLASYCMVVKHDYPDAQAIVGIATEPGTDPDTYRSEDAIYFDARDWTEEMEAEALCLKNELGLLTNTRKFASREYEYPTPKKKSRKRHKSKKR